MTRPIQFQYMNWRGVVALRTVTFESLEWLPNPGFDYKPGWFLTGHCHDKNARRSFSLENIVLPHTENVYKLLAWAEPILQASEV